MTDAYPPFRLDQRGAEPVQPRGPIPPVTETPLAHRRTTVPYPGGTDGQGLLTRRP
jgi:hypothetical protein